MPILTQSTSRGNLEDLDGLATTYAHAWTTATTARRSTLRDDLIRCCLPFAGRMARRYAGRGEPFDDLHQVARIGLVKAVDRYNPYRGSFTAFAVITICGELKRHFRDTTWGLHVTRRLQNLSIDLKRATEALTNALQREPTIEELANDLGVSAKQIRHARLCGASHTPLLLSTHTGDDGARGLGDALGDPDPDLENLTDKLAVTELLHLLPQNTQRMLTLRFSGNLTQAQIAAEFNMSQMQVSRLLSRALAWLRAALLGEAPPLRIAGVNALHPDGMRIRMERSEGAVTIRVSGDVDRDTADRLRLSLRSAVVAAAHCRLVIDVTDMPLQDAAAVAVLRDALRAAALARVKVTLTAAQPHVATVIATLGPA